MSVKDVTMYDASTGIGSDVIETKLVRSQGVFKTRSNVNELDTPFTSPVI